MLNVLVWRVACDSNSKGNKVQSEVLIMRLAAVAVTVFNSAMDVGIWLIYRSNVFANRLDVTKNSCWHSAVCRWAGQRGSWAVEEMKGLLFPVGRLHWCHQGGWRLEDGFPLMPDGLCHALQLFVISTATPCLSLFITGLGEQSCMLSWSFSLTPSHTSFTSAGFFFFFCLLK